MATGGWLFLSRQGLSPCKKHQAWPTLFISFSFTITNHPFNRHGHSGGPDAEQPGNLRQRNPQFPV